MSKGLEAFYYLMNIYGLRADGWKKYQLVEKELKTLEIIKEKNIDLKTLKIANLCEVDNKKQCEIYNANRWRWVEDNDFYGSPSVPSKNITQEEYDLLREVLL